VARPNILLTAWTAAQRIDQLVTRELEAADAWSPHYATLSMIGIRGRITPTALAAEMGVKPTTLSDRVAELVALGHVKRRANPEDGRSYLLELTASGRRILERAAPATHRVHEAVARNLDQSLADVEAAIEALTRAVEAALAEQRDRRRPQRAA
jgi:DNA-binding MarR family transcriptional regulator